MHPDLEKALRQQINQYNELHAGKQLTKENIQHHKDACREVLAERMLHVDRESDEYKECDFIQNALSNGWLVSDIDPLRAYYQAVQKLPKGNNKTEGEACLYIMASYKAETLMDRMEMLGRADTNLYSIKFDDPKEPVYRNAFNSVHNHFYNRAVYPVEYPDDQNFGRLAGKEDLSDGIKYAEISNSDNLKDNYNRVAEELRRTNDVYYIPQVDDAMNAELAENFEIGKWHRYFGGITKKASTAVKMSMGADVYDEIYEMSRGSASDRKVKLYHSLGTKYQKQGHDVLEFEFAGTSGKDVIRQHKGRGGDLDLSKYSAETIKTTFGTKVQKKGKPNEFFDFTWKKDRTIQTPDGKNAEKIRYTFGGPNYINIGEYSVQNSRDNAAALAEEFLERKFNEWRNGTDPKPIHISLSGHSRGAVTAGQAAIKIHEWIMDYIKKHPGSENFKNFVNYDLILRDPVPGFGTNRTIGDCDLRKIPNVNCTVICSLGIQAPDDICPLQHIRGSKKVILNMEDHLMDIDQTDNTQMGVTGNTKEGHMVSYFDSETGEMHRGSGLSELPDGVYVADEKYRLIRVTSYSQVKELYDSAFDHTKSQKIRTRRIHKMVRDWFCENDLQMSFTDEEARKAEEAKNEGIKDRILGMNVKDLRSVQEDIKMVDHLKSQPNVPKEAVIEANKLLIQTCRKYMKDTTMPPKGISAEKAGLVGDLMSFAMRENNQLSKELNLVPENDPRAVLDTKIRAQKDKLESGEGYLNTKLNAENKRLANEKSIENIIKNTRQCCKENLESLTQIGQLKKKNAKFKAVLEEGSKLGEKTSVREMKDFLKRFGDLAKSEGYETLRRAASTTGTKLNELSAGMGNLDIPIGVRIRNRQANIDHLTSRQQELARPAQQRQQQQQQQQQQLGVVR